MPQREWHVELVVLLRCWSPVHGQVDALTFKFLLFEPTPLAGGPEAFKRKKALTIREGLEAGRHGCLSATCFSVHLQGLLRNRTSAKTPPWDTQCWVSGKRHLLFEGSQLQAIQFAAAN